MNVYSKLNYDDCFHLFRVMVSSYDIAFILIIMKMNVFMSTTSHNDGEIENLTRKSYRASRFSQDMV